MESQNLFSGKNERNASVGLQLKILPRVLSVKPGMPVLIFPAQSDGQKGTASRQVFFLLFQKLFIFTH